MRSLERLVLDGNGADDAAMQHIAAVPRLRWGVTCRCVLHGLLLSRAAVQGADGLRC